MSTLDPLAPDELLCKLDVQLVETSIDRGVGLERAEEVRMRPHGIVIYVDDLNAGVEFYKTLLGRSPRTLEQKRGFAEFDLDGFNFIVHETPVSTPEKPAPSR